MTLNHRRVRQDEKEEIEREALELRRAVGQQLLGLRNAAGVNQDEFAFMAHIHRAHVGKIENGTVSPTFDTLYKFARALGVELSEVMAAAEKGR